MNQPKFKFGDKVESLTSDPFIVHGIRAQGESYIYFDSNPARMGFMEDVLELHKEPQKKKLYAYIEKCKYMSHTCGDIHYKKIHLVDKEDSALIAIVHWTRAREYDIEYPEAK